MPSIDLKLQRLRATLAAMERVVIAYSGGVDSSFLGAVAHEVLGSGAVLVTAVSPSLPRQELDSAHALATSRGWHHLTVATREVGREEYARNRPDRCYWCKDTLFETLDPIAADHQAVIAVGTNTDDLGEHRPGLRAAAEREVRAPLVEAELAKAEIRTLSARMSLPTADKPAGPCLASRFAYGVRVTPAGLRRIEAAERFLHGRGFEVVRVRDEGSHARVEVDPPLVERAMAIENEIDDHLKRLGFETVVVDPRGYRRGAMNETLDHPVIRSSAAG